MAKTPEPTGLDDMMTTSDVAEMVANGEFEESTPLISRVIYDMDAPPALASLEPLNLSVAQGMSKSVKERRAAIGQLTVPNYPPLDELVLIPLAGGPFREYMPDRTKSPACFSPNGVQGFGNPGGSCAACPLSKWGSKDPKTGRSQKPGCDEGVSVDFYSPTHTALLRFRFKRREMRSGEQILQRAAFSGWTNFAVKMTTQDTSNASGSWFVPNIEFVMDVPSDDKEKAQMAFEMLRNSQRQKYAELSAGEGNGHGSSAGTAAG